MSTPEEAIEPDVLRRWNLSAIREYLKRIWMVISGGDPERGPRDYSELDDERGVMMHIIKEQMKRLGSNGHGNVHESKWSTWVLGIVGALIVASVLGLISAMFTMTGRMAALETKVDMLIMTRK